MRVIDISKKTIWARASKVTGLAAVVENNHERPFYLMYKDSKDKIGEVFIRNGWAVMLYSNGKWDDGHRNVVFKARFENASDAKSFLSDVYRKVATAEEGSQYFSIRKILNWF